MNATAGAVGSRRTGMTARGFGQLLKKELRGQESLFPLLALLTLLWELFLLTRLPIWGRELVGGLSAIPLALVPFWALWAGFQSVRAEWIGDHAQMLLSFPVPYWQIQGTKLLAIAIQAAATAAVSGIMALILLSPLLEETSLVHWEAVRASWLLAAGLLYTLTSFHLAVFGQFVSAAWRSVGRYGALVAIWSAILAGWTGSRLSGLLGYLFQWVPDLRILSINIQSSGTQTQVFTQPIVVDTAPLLGSVLFALILFAVGAILLERAADV